jgi:proline iminopeptidase
VTGRTQQAVWDSLGDAYDLRPALRTLHVPAIVLHGDDDPIPLATARATAEALGAEFVVLPKAGHVPYVEAAAEFTAALDRFLPHA